MIFNKLFKGKKQIEGCRGYFEYIDCTDDILTIAGWMVVLGKNIEKFILKFNNELFFEKEVFYRDDVAKVFNFLPQSGYSGFNFNLPIDKKYLKDFNDIKVVAISDELQIAQMKTWYIKDFTIDTSIPIELMKRVANTENHSCFHSISLTSFRDYFELACLHKGKENIRRLLDWGCGCGRIIRLFSKFTDIQELYGCDIDREAIEWCKEKIKGVNFYVNDLYPPLNYNDNFFDLVIANSVLTHLKAKEQIKWLNEMRRVIKKDGILIASLNGELVTYFTFPDSYENILEKGIYDEMEDESLACVVPKGYYKATFQSKYYTKKIFSRYFKIIDYIEGGSLNFQDIIVLKNCYK